MPVPPFVKKLYEAVKEQKVDRIRELLAKADAQEMKDVNSPHANFIHGHTLLTLAAQHNWLRSAEALLDNGADINAGEAKFGLQAIHTCTAFDHVEMMELLASRGASLTSTSRIGDETPLDQAVGSLAEGCVKYLLGQGVHQRLDYSTVAHQILRFPRNSRRDREKARRVCGMLRNAGIDIDARDDHGCTLLFHTASMGQVELAIELMQEGANACLMCPCTVQYGGQKLAASRNALHEMCARAPKDHRPGVHATFIESAIRNGVDINDYETIPATPDAQRTALLHAASTRKYEAVAHLLHHGAKPNQSEMEQRRTALHIAADAKDVRMMLQLASSIEVVVTRKDSGNSTIVSRVSTGGRRRSSGGGAVTVLEQVAQDIVDKKFEQTEPLEALENGRGLAAGYLGGGGDLGGAAGEGRVVDLSDDTGDDSRSGTGAHGASASSGALRPAPGPAASSGAGSGGSGLQPWFEKSSSGGSSGAAPQAASSSASSSSGKFLGGVIARSEHERIVDQLHARNRRLQQQLDALNMRMPGMQARAQQQDAVNRELSKAQQSAKTKAARVTELSTLLQEEKGKVVAVETKLAASQEQVQRAKAQYDTAHTNYTAKNRECNELRSKLTLIEQQRQAELAQYARLSEQRKRAAAALEAVDQLRTAKLRSDAGMAAAEDNAQRLAVILQGNQRVMDQMTLLLDRMQRRIAQLEPAAGAGAAAPAPKRSPGRPKGKRGAKSAASQAAASSAADSEQAPLFASEAERDRCEVRWLCVQALLRDRAQSRSQAQSGAMMGSGGGVYGAGGGQDDLLESFVKEAVDDLRRPDALPQFGIGVPIVDGLRGAYSAKAQISTVVEAALRSAGLQRAAHVSVDGLPGGTTKAGASMRLEDPATQELARAHTARVMGMAPASALVAPFADNGNVAGGASSSSSSASTAVEVASQASDATEALGSKRSRQVSASNPKPELDPDTPTKTPPNEASDSVDTESRAGSGKPGSRKGSSQIGAREAGSRNGTPASKRRRTAAGV